MALCYRHKKILRYQLVKYLFTSHPDHDMIPISIQEIDTQLEYLVFETVKHLKQNEQCELE